MIPSDWENGVDMETDIVQFLANGNRLECPQMCPEYVYKGIILPCWNENDFQRPPFRSLQKFVLFEIKYFSRWKRFSLQEGLKGNVYTDHIQAQYSNQDLSSETSSMENFALH